MKPRTMAVVYFPPHVRPLAQSGTNSLVDLPSSIHHSQRGDASPCCILELPARGAIFPAVFKYPKGDGTDDVILSFIRRPKEQADEPIDGIQHAKTFSPAPLWMRILIDEAKDRYARLIEAAPEQQSRLNVWLNGPLDFRALVDRRQDKNRIRAQNMAIAILWDKWERRELSLAERAEELKAFGNITPDTLRRRAERLGF